MLKQFCSGFILAVWLMSSGNAAEASLAPQTIEERGVKVTVTPPKLAKEAKTWDFEVVLETHTQDLSDDLTKSSVLFADGKRYTPFEWNGAAPGGHHRKGVLRFNAISPQPQEMELQVRLKGDLAPRNFKWRLNRKSA